MIRREDRIKRIKLTIDGRCDFETALRASRQMLPADQAPCLLAWFDLVQGQGGPAEPCGDEGSRCVRDYGESHGADYEVTVNDGVFTFYFLLTPRDALSPVRGARCQ